MSFCNSLTFFRIWTSAKTQPTSNVIWRSHGVHLVNINVYAKFHHNIPLSSRGSAIITLSEFKSWAKPRPMKNVISQSLGLDLVSINVYPTVYQNIPLGLRDRAIFTFSDLVNINVYAKVYQNLNLGNASANPKWHLTISWATSCQYQCVCRILSKYSKGLRVMDIFHEQAGVKIFTNCPVTRSNVWL